MNIEKHKIDDTITIKVDGSLDTSTSPMLASEMVELDGIKKVVLDFSSLDYISSSGLRILLSVQKRMNKTKGELIVKNIGQTVEDIFEITGFTDILNIQWIYKKSA